MRITLFKDRFYVFIGQRKHPESLYEKGVALQTSPVKRNLSNAFFPEAKTNAYQNSLLATLEPTPSGVYEWVFLDRNGFVTEVRIGNLFIVKKNALATPPLLGILNGVTRRVVIECAREKKIAVSEAPLTRHEFYNADEAFLTNTSWEILPVRMLDGRKVGPEVPGPLTLKLHELFKQKVLKECP